MSIRIHHLTKRYGQQKAVDDISFAIEPGEIVGFLGPNGAGKSTTMKITTGFIPADGGDVWVNDIPVVEKPLEAKRVIGYLPEHNPLYLDMYVHEYLSFIATLYQVPRHQRAARVREMISLCGLTPEQNKLIGSLSKGYRQRVGLAQALIHNPPVLILDEPTTGLDPNQIIEIRQLIKNISAEKTVIFSTHIMQEVQALCDRVIIINKGRIVADDTLKNLLHGRVSQAVLVVEFKEDITEELFRELDGVERIQQRGRQWMLHTRQSTDIRPALLQLVSQRRLSLISMLEEEDSMEEIFRSLTAPAAS